jgi:hypothetical protein
MRQRPVLMQELVHGKSGNTILIRQSITLEFWALRYTTQLRLDFAWRFLRLI